MVTPDRAPLVLVCRCCGKPFGQVMWQPAYIHPKKTIPGKFIITCLTPGCALNGATATDECYVDTTEPYLKSSKGGVVNEIVGL